MTARRFRYAGIAVAALAAAAGLALALSGANTPARGPLVLFFLAVAPAVAIGGLLRDLDPIARLIIAVTGAIALDYLVAETMLAAGAWSPAGGLVAVLVIVAACFAVQIPLVRGRLHASLKASQALAGRLAAVAWLQRAVTALKARRRWAAAAAASALAALAFIPAVPAVFSQSPAALHGPAGLPPRPAVHAPGPAATASPARPGIRLRHRRETGPPIPGQRQAGQSQPHGLSSTRTRSLAPGHSAGPPPSHSPAPAPGPSTRPPSPSASPSPSPSPTQPPSPSPSPSRGHKGCVVLLGVRVCL
jgi:hypothetical protein